MYLVKWERIHLRWKTGHANQEIQDGNVPIALQRWEVLGLRDEIDPLR